MQASSFLLVFHCQLTLEFSLILDCKTFLHWSKSQHFHDAYKYMKVERLVCEFKMYGNLSRGQWVEEGTKDKIKSVNILIFPKI